jgi:hypothetical protein
MPRLVALSVLLFLGLDGCCHCPPPSDTRKPAAPPPASLRLPTGLGPPRLSPPGSLDALLKDLKARASSFAAFRDALASYVGAARTSACGSASWPAPRSVSTGPSRGDGVTRLPTRAASLA